MMKMVRPSVAMAAMLLLGCIAMVPSIMAVTPSFLQFHRQTTAAWNQCPADDATTTTTTSTAFDQLLTQMGSQLGSVVNTLRVDNAAQITVRQFLDSSDRTSSGAFLNDWKTTTTSTNSAATSTSLSGRCEQLPLPPGACYHVQEPSVPQQANPHRHLLTFAPLTGHAMHVVVAVVALFEELGLDAYLQPPEEQPVGGRRRTLRAATAATNTQQTRPQLRQRRAQEEQFDFTGGEASYIIDASWDQSLLSDLLDSFSAIADYLVLQQQQKSMETITSMINHEDARMCRAWNNETVAMASSHGVPPSIVYRFCQCATKTLGLDQTMCGMQASLTAFAATKSALHEWEYTSIGASSLPDQVWDGFTDQSLATASTNNKDVWVTLDVQAVFPKLAPTDTTTTTTMSGLEVLECAQATSNGDSKLQLKASLLTELGDTSQEFVSMVAVEQNQANIVVNDNSIFQFDIPQVAYGGMRLQSEQPICRPEGIFVTYPADQQFSVQLGSQLSSFVQGLVPRSDRTKDFGVTFWPNMAQSMFLRFQADFQWLGIPIENGQVELQYMDENELVRRKTFAASGCDAPTSKIVLKTPPKIENTQEPAVVASFDMKYNVVTWGVLTFKDVIFNIVLQPSQDPQVYLEAQVLAPGFDWLPTEVNMVVDDSNLWRASFVSDILDIVSTFPVSISGSNVLGSSGSALTVSDNWDLKIIVDWQKLDDKLEETVLASAGAQQPVVQTQTASSRQGNNQKSQEWEDIMRLAKEFKDGSIGNVLDGLNDFIKKSDDSTTAVQEALRALVNILETGMVGSSNSLLQAQLSSDDIAAAMSAYSMSRMMLIDGNMPSLASKFDMYDWDFDYALGGLSKSTYGKQEEKNKEAGQDPFWMCDIVSYEWTECDTLANGGARYNCRDFASGVFPQAQCIKEKAAGILDLHSLVTDALWIADNCSGDQTTELQTDRQQVMPLAPGVSVQAPNEFEFGTTDCAMPFEVSFNRYASDGRVALSSFQGTSNVCLDFSSSDGIATSLTDFLNEVAQEVSAVASVTPSGGSCTPLDARQCGQPSLSVQESVASEIVTCGDARTLDLSSSLGDVQVAVDMSCMTVWDPIFLVGDTNDEKAGKRNNAVVDESCSSTTVTVKRVGKDCCQQTTTAEQTVVVQKLSPSFLTTPGSMDQTLACDANIHPAVTGTPEYTRGCDEAFQSIDVVDEATLDSATCTTTVKRSFLLREDGCEETEQVFVQTFTLPDNTTPQWDFFPPDVSISFFSPIGTDALGFPTAYAPCGANPVWITSEDSVPTPDGCGFYVMERTFTASDACGRQLVRTQKISIGETQLPLGDKSLSMIYSGTELLLGRENVTACVVSSLACGVNVGASTYQCGLSSFNEFDTYIRFLDNRGSDGVLNTGPLKRTCSCSDGRDCAKDVKKDSLEAYGVPAAIQADEKSCNTVQSAPLEGGTPLTVILDCPTGATGCIGKKLLGYDPVYNVFSIPAEDLTAYTISIDVPTTSFVLINVYSSSGATLSVDNPRVQGVLLNNGLPASQVIWNVPNALNLLIRRRGSGFEPYSWYGTMINRRGSLYMDFDRDQVATWQGQIFTNRLAMNNVNHNCGGHFVGFIPAGFCNLAP